MAAQPVWRRLGVLVVFGAGVWAVAATGAPLKVISLPDAPASIRLDADHPVALTPVHIAVPLEADPATANEQFLLFIDAVRPAGPATSAGSGSLDAIQGPAAAPPGVTLVVTAAVPVGSATEPVQGHVSTPAPWQAEVHQGRPADLPVACDAGPCERAFWLVAQLENAATGAVEVDWHVQGSLQYTSMHWPDSATAAITIGSVVRVAGPVPALATATDVEAITIGPDAPAAARVLEVSIDQPDGVTGVPAAVLRVDVRRTPESPYDAEAPLVQVIPIPGGPDANPTTPLPPDADPFAGCADPGRCTRQFLVTFAWTGGHNETGTFDWTATVRRTDLLAVWTTPAAITADVVRAIDLAQDGPTMTRIAGDVTPVVGDPEPEVRLRIRAHTTSGDPVSDLLPVPARLTYRATLIGASPEEMKSQLDLVAITPSIGERGGLVASGVFENGKVEVVMTPTASRSEACWIGAACPDVAINLTPRTTGSSGLTERADARFQWAVDLETWSWEDIPLEVDMSDDRTSPVPPGSFGRGLTCLGDAWPPRAAAGMRARGVSASARDSATIEVRNQGPRTVYLRVSGWEVVQLEDCRGLIQRELATLPLEPGMSDLVDLLWMANEPGMPLTVSVYLQPCGEGRCRQDPEVVIIVPRSIVEPVAS